VAQLVLGHRVIISAMGVPAVGDDRGSQFVDSGLALIDGARAARVARVLIVGGGGSLEVSPGLQWVDTENFLPGNPRQPTDALAHRELLRRLQLIDDVDWTYLSPPMRIYPGERTGRYRKGTNSMLFDNAGVSQISMEDYAVAMVDELECAAHHHERFTVAY
jgi:putative NADH-flavin reductase